MVKHLPTMRETRVRSLGWEDPLEKEMATYSSVLALRIPGMGEPGGLPSMGSQSRKRLKPLKQQQQQHLPSSGIQLGSPAL